MAVVRALSGNDENIVQCREGDNVLRSGDLRGDGYGNPSQMESLFPAGIEVPRAGEGDAFLGQKGEGCEGGLVIHTSGRMNGGLTDPGFHKRWRVLECLSRALAHTSGLKERSSEAQPAHTDSGEGGTTGKDSLAKTPQARSVGDLVEKPAGAHPTRGTEKLIEYKTYLQALPYSDRSEGDRGVTE
ncbi:NADH dehydrogenase [Datura stramonium]|uniref:NADH dehydrogenase [ubiquinone] iron-sulfur protein 2 n=1 Tax=Datura stramonium TaxID=4076 RepID=A0ABS8RRR3_DATST|nr:NADH dehydrogenase [ubiquinone] iron-sulfur protein 2 [Datura stramonium]